METTTDDFNLTSGRPKDKDMAHTKVDPYQDPAYNASPQSPAHASEVLPCVGQEDSMCAQVPSSVGQEDSMVSAPPPSPSKGDTDLP